MILCRQLPPASASTRTFRFVRCVVSIHTFKVWIQVPRFRERCWYVWETKNMTLTHFLCSFSAKNISDLCYSNISPIGNGVSLLTAPRLLTVKNKLFIGHMCSVFTCCLLLCFEKLPRKYWIVHCESCTGPHCAPNDLGRCNHAEGALRMRCDDSGGNRNPLVFTVRYKINICEKLYADRAGVRNSMQRCCLPYYT